MMGVCILTLNSEATIGFVIDSILKQDVPGDQVFYVVVDGGSKDRTVEIVKDRLLGLKYDIISAPGTNIPQARNVCIDVALKRGFEKLVFIDSDTVLLSKNVLKLADKLSSVHRGSIIHFSTGFLYFKDVGELDRFLKRDGYLELREEDVRLRRSLEVGMGCTVVPRGVFEKVRFDGDMDFSEDVYYSLRAFAEGFDVLAVAGTEKHVVDVNIMKDAVSDIYWKMPLRRYLRASRKKALVRYLCSLDVQSLRVSRSRFLMRLSKFLANTLLLFILVLTPIAYLLHAGVFYVFLAADLLNMVLYPLIKKARGYPLLLGVLNRFKFMVFSLLMTLWSIHAYRELERFSEAFRRRHYAMASSVR